MPRLPLLLDKQLNICEPVVEYVLGELGVCELTGADPSRLKRTCIKIARGGGTAFLPPRCGE